MKKYFSRFIMQCHALPLAVLLMAISLSAFSQSKENRFVDHGVAFPISNHRGTLATLDETGQDVVLIWLFDHTEGYALLM